MSDLELVIVMIAIATALILAISKLLNAVVLLIIAWRKFKKHIK
ncbi:hypothetical protein LOT_0854 [Lentilactobacillus otakiensis DSM 19908 = JCM 15040]|uniref:Uncharacterized protein n=1 Tax=Lentilactobacillus otakiensis DSM 19908 = JCM 15040 TaxID=1423780 RepID=S4NK77_9LACO|nr:hypothetical protein LOT_0854 [Lentilactobacillus otakiensis DSM 19908 = JCM 15040]